MEKRLSKLNEVRENRGWFLLFGLFLIALGIAIISDAYLATVFTVVALGIFLICAGVVQIAQAFVARKWSGVFLELFLGILYIVTGFLCVAKPRTAAISITLWIAGFCIIVGLFRMLTALFLRFEQWGWVFLNGLVTFILGWLIYSNWPISGLWVIGLFIGIDLILSGWAWVILALTARQERGEGPSFS
jgi:uncharacterized membrane protein HdeD (DUF308 family)